MNKTILVLPFFVIACAVDDGSPIDDGWTMQNVCTSDFFLTPHPTTTLSVPPGGPFDQLAAP